MTAYLSVDSRYDFSPMVQTARDRRPEASARAALLAAAAPTGGWPYYANGSSRIEPTAWALLALGPSGARPQQGDALARARGFLRTLQRPDGLLVEPATPGPNYGWNGLALLALNGDDLDVADRLANGLLRVKGIQVDGDPNVVRQDGRLQAWSWTEGTFSWAEPTAYCLLALKVRRAAGADAAARIAEAEAVLFDRVCDPGGWNYGNSAVLAQDLRPYVPTTALGLLALQDRRDHPVVVRSLAWLEAHALAERSTMALALAATALFVHGRPIEPVLSALDAQQARTSALGNFHLAAMAAFALSLPDHRGAAVTIPLTPAGA